MKIQTLSREKIIELLQDYADTWVDEVMNVIETQNAGNVSSVVVRYGANSGGITMVSLYDESSYTDIDEILADVQTLSNIVGKEQ